MKNLFLVLLGIVALTSCSKQVDQPAVLPVTDTAAVTGDVITLTKRGDGTIYILDASYIKPGTTVVLEGSYKSIQIRNIQGTATSPITFVNKGQVTIGGYASYTAILQGKYFRVLGNGDPAIKYGIRLTSTNSSYYAFGFSLGNSTNVEIANCEIDHFHAGIIQNPTSGFAMVNCYYHDNYIHDLDYPEAGGRSEAFYLGNTTPTSYKASYRFSNCRIENNLLSNLKGDGIQVCNGSFTIKGNTIKNYGLAQLKDQYSGILVGGNAAAKITNNVIDGGRGIAIFILGVGDNVIQGNTIKNIDVSNLTNIDIVYINARVNTTDGAPLLKLTVSNNSIQGKTSRFGLADMTPLTLTSGGSFSGNTISGSYLKAYAINSKDSWVP